jgi:bcr-type benzoyl-CoA reductase subunit C
MFAPFHEVIAGVSECVRKFARESGRPVIGVMPAYFPMELVHAAGGYPVQLWGNNLPIERADAYLQSYCCSVARSVLELELRGSAAMVKGYVFTSLCDTLINLREIYRRLFDKPTLEFSIPITRTEKARREYLATVVDGLLKGLSEATGRPLTAEALADSARLYGRMRGLQRELYALRRERPGLMRNADFYAAVKAGFFLPVEEYSRRLEKLLGDLKKAGAGRAAGPRLVLSGMVFDPLEACAIFDEIGAAVVDDDFANGWRTAAKPALSTEPLVDGVAAYLFDAAPCCCIYNPDNDRHPYLVAKARQARAQGVVFWYTKFCEPDAFDRPQLAERLKAEGIPATTVEMELSMRNFDAVRTRIQAFCEIIGGQAA